MIFFWGLRLLIYVSNFTDYNTISTNEGTLKKLLHHLVKSSEKAIRWFGNNSMIVNTENVQMIAVGNKIITIILNG